MKYKITFNIPNEKFPVDIVVSEEVMEAFYQGMQTGNKVVKINGSYFNSAYFAKAVPATEDTVLEESQKKLIEKGLVDDETELHKRIRLTQQKHDNETKLLWEVQ